MVASSSALIVQYDDYTDWHDYIEISDNGYIRNHDPEGDTLYGIEMMVDPDVSRPKARAAPLRPRASRCAATTTCARMIIGGRIPGYAQHADELSAHEYVEEASSTSSSSTRSSRRSSPTAFSCGSSSRTTSRTTKTRAAGRPASSGRTSTTSRASGSRSGRRRVGALRRASRWCSTGCGSSTPWEEFEKQCEFFVDTASRLQGRRRLLPGALHRPAPVAHRRAAARRRARASWPKLTPKLPRALRSTRDELQRSTS